MEEEVKMNIIFLDIDGVLNNQTYANILNTLYKNSNGYGGRNKYKLSTKNIKWDLYNVYNLKLLMNKANVVISSTWRYTHSINNFKMMFQLYGLKPNKIIGTTPDLRGQILTIRGDDINAYLNTNSVDKYVILDDGSDFYDDQVLVQTDPKYGFTPTDLDKAMKLLI